MADGRTLRTSLTPEHRQRIAETMQRLAKRRKYGAESCPEPVRLCNRCGCKPVAHNYKCAGCYRSYQREWRRRRGILERPTDWVEDPKKVNARQKLRYAAAKGVLVRPKLCQQCGQLGARIEGHHGDHSKPLDVVWLCSKCHSAITHLDHKRKIKQANPK
jgi:hypothetical protein